MEILIYGTPTCTKCNDVQAYLQQKAVDYEYKVIGEDVDHETVNKVVGRIVRAAPVIMVDDAEMTFQRLRERVNNVNILHDLEL